MIEIIKRSPDLFTYIFIYFLSLFVYILYTMPRSIKEEDVLLVKSNKNVFSFKHDFSKESYDKAISFSSFKNRFYRIQISVVTDHNSLGDKIYVRVHQHGSNSTFKVTVDAIYNGSKVTDVMDNQYSECFLFSGHGLYFRKQFYFKFQFAHVRPVHDGNIGTKRMAIGLPIAQTKGTRTLFEDAKKFLNGGQQVTLIASNGRVMVPERLLMARSSAFEAMFTHDTIEKRKLEVNLSEFEENVLESFVHFFSTDQILNGKDTSLQLYILADKYDIQSLKVKARQDVLFNIKHLDKQHVMNVFSKIEPNTVKNGILLNH